MKNKNLACLLAIVCACSLLFAGCSKKQTASEGTGDKAGKVYTMKMTHAYPETTQHGRNAKFFKELVEKETNGRVKVQIYPNAQLGGSDKEVGMVQAGTVEAAYSICGSIETIEPLEAIWTIPFLWKASPVNSDHYIAASKYNGLIESTLREKLKAKGIYRLGIFNTQNGQFIAGNNKRPILKPEDMSGLKIRHSGGMLGTLQIEKLGASPVTIAGAEVPVALSQGVIDGLQTGVLHMHDARWHTKYVTATYSKCYSIPMLLNLKWWESLPADIQDIIQSKVFPQCQKYGNEETSRRDREALEAMKKEPYNVQVTLIPDNELETWAKFNNVREEGIKKYLSVVGPEGQKLIDEVNRVKTELEKKK